jgi:hypothetical protein
MELDLCLIPKLHDEIQPAVNTCLRLFAGPMTY